MSANRGLVICPDRGEKKKKITYHFESGQNYRLFDTEPLFFFLISLAHHQMEIECTQGVNFNTGTPATVFNWAIQMIMACECLLFFFC